MNGLLREGTPYSLRIVIALAVLVFATTSWLFIVNVFSVISFTTATLGVLVLITAFLILGVLACASHTRALHQQLYQRS